MDEYIAIIKIFGGDFAPKGWAKCQGQLLSIAQNTALFSLIGTTYGGNGQTTFALPDLRGRAPIGYGQGPGLNNYALGQVSGTENVTLTTANIPPHNHMVSGTVKLPVNADSSATDNPEEAYLAPTASNNYNTSPSSGAYSGNLSVDLTTGATGNGLPISIMQPTLAMNYIICLEGVFPSRG